MQEESYYPFVVNTPNLSRRAFISSLGVAAAAPSVVANAIKAVPVKSSFDAVYTWVIDWETIDLKAGYWNRPLFTLTDKSGNIQYIHIHDKPTDSIPLNG